MQRTCLISPGDKFDRLVVLNREVNGKGRRNRWRCRCACGNVIICGGQDLRVGKTRSCGCLSRERCIARSTKHGMRHTRTYRIYYGMLGRCRDEHNPAWPNYGGRGITVCQRWLADFRNFVEDMGECPEGLTLERRDNSQGYSPENCYWATRLEQNYNKRNNRLITIGGITKCLSAWARDVGIYYRTIHTRLKLGWSEEAAVMTPVRPHRIYGSPR